MLLVDLVDFHQQPCKFSNSLKISDSLRSDIFRKSQTFSDCQLVSNWELPFLIPVKQLYRLFQTDSFLDIQTVRICQLFSVHKFYIYSITQNMSVIFSSPVRWSERYQLFSVWQFQSHTENKNLSANASPVVVKYVSIPDYQLFSDILRHFQSASWSDVRIPVCQLYPVK